MANYPYVVRQGDTVVSVVAKIGGDPDSVWNDPANDALRGERPDPAILCPGDVIYLPVMSPTYLDVTVGSTNTFAGVVPTQPLTIVIAGGQPLANEPYAVDGFGDDIRGTTDGDGSLTLDVPVPVTSFVLQLTNRGVAHTVMVGQLDPISESSGVGQRLSNLGYASVIAPVAASFGLQDTFTVEQQIQIFQLAAGIDPTGDVCADTLDALGKAHGT